MAVTPLVANGRLQISYKSDLPHVENLLCTIVEVGGVWSLQEFGGTTIPANTVANNYASFIKGFFDSTTQITGWILELYASGAYIEVAAGSIGILGTNSNPNVAASSLSWTFKDTLNKGVQFRQLGAAEVLGAFKNGYSALGGVYLAYVNELLDVSAGHLGAEITGRGGTHLALFRANIGAFNRKSRRRLGLV